MANICSNKMYVSSPNKESLQQIHDFMSNWVNALLEEIDENSFEYYFDSRWDFPKEAMQEMTDSIKDTKGLYIKVLSIEECNYYAAYNVFEDGVWVTK
jgi:hypothetical protein